MNFDGILNVYKEPGYTSFDVVARIRRITGIKKVGHTGTLDPDAVGVLPVCLGSATKVCDLLMDETKEYVAIMRLGVVTDTQDMSGSVLEEHYDVAREIPDTQIEDAIMSFEGDIEQIPPMYSAVKVNGQKLCDLARKGKEIDRKPRKVRIENIEILRRPEQLFGSYVNYEIRVTCSKGTYIRTLINDIGQKLGCGAAMEHLERTRVGKFKVEDALTIDQIKEIWERESCDRTTDIHDVEKSDVYANIVGGLHNTYKAVDIMFEQHAPLHVTEQGMRALNNGNQIQENDIREVVEGMKLEKRVVYRIYSYDNQFRALYEYHSGWNVLKPVKIFSIG